MGSKNKKIKKGRSGIAPVISINLFMDIDPQGGTTLVYQESDGQLIHTLELYRRTTKTRNVFTLHYSSFQKKDTFTFNFSTHDRISMLQFSTELKKYSNLTELAFSGIYFKSAIAYNIKHPKFTLIDRKLRTYSPS